MDDMEVIRQRYELLTAQLDLPELSGTVNDCVEQLLNKLRDTQEALGKVRDDSKLLDWLDKNIHRVSMDDFDQKAAPNSNEWGFYAPKKEDGHNVYGRARDILGAAMRRDEDPSDE